MKKPHARHWALAAAVAAATLAACGGGGGSDDPTPTAGPLTVSGTAAKGAALAGATVDVKCASGTASATAAGDGSYTVNLASATLPCALRASGTEGSVFHAVVPGSGAPGSATVRANITPLTEMMVAQLAGASPASYFTAFGSGSSVSDSGVSAAVTFVKTAVAGITDLGTANPLTDTLVVGNALDLKIDALMAALSSQGVTLAEVSTAIAANPNAPTVVAAPIAPSAEGCTWLKSGRYRMISPYETDPRWRAHVLTVDAPALTARDQDNQSISLTQTGACQYSNNDGEFTSSVMVANSGILVVHSQSNSNASQRTLTIGLPEQTLPLSEFAGTWNTAGWDPHSGTATTAGYVAQNYEVTFNAGGQITATKKCIGLAPCTAGTPPFVSFATHADGGFNLVEDGQNAGRVFLFKTLAGKAAWVMMADDGEFIVATRQQSLGALPAVGTTTYFREFNLLGNGSISTVAEQQVTVTATDAAANTQTRLRASDGRIDTVAMDSPLLGLRHRVGNSCTINGAPSNCSETVQLPMQGMGLTLSLSVGVTNPASAFYVVSVTRPAPVVD